MSEKVLDVRGLKCPMPIVKAKKEIGTIGAEDELKVVSTDRGSVLDFQGWVKQNPAYRLAQEEGKDETGREIYIHRLRKA